MIKCEGIHHVTAHELRTPLQPILSTVGLLSSANLTMITENKSTIPLHDNQIATRLKQISEHILDVTKIRVKH